MTDAIEWGEPIPVNGEKPEWLKSSDVWEWVGAKGTWFRAGGGPNDYNWEVMPSIRLLADHSHYRKHTEQPDRPSDEVVELPEYGEWLPNAWDGYLVGLLGRGNVERWVKLPATFRWSELYEQHIKPAILAELEPEPVDPLVEALREYTDLPELPPQDADSFREMLAKRGLQITPVQS